MDRSVMLRVVGGNAKAMKEQHELDLFGVGN